MESHVRDLQRLEKLLERERAARTAAIKASEEAWNELSTSLRGFVRELAETRTFLDNILASSTEYSIIAKDLERRVVLWNEGARRNYGWEADEVLGRSSDILHAEEDLESDVIPRLHHEALEHGMAEGRFMRKRRDGSKFPASVVITRREDADGNPIGYLLISRDISIDLEKERLEQATQELEKERLVAAEADRLKSEFLANMSHELRTPLNSIIGFSDLLMGKRPGPLTGRQEQHLTDISSSARHLLALINDILDLSKIDTGRIAFEPTSIDLHGFCRQLIETVRDAAEAAGVQITTDIEENSPPIFADPIRLRQIVLNYLDNAIKFSPPGGETLLRARTEGDELVVEVVDHGPGVPKDQRGRLFHPFEQLDASVAKRHGGTGLGLALALRLAEAQGGSVGMEPTPKGGSTFWLRLPRTQPQPPQRREQMDEVRHA